MEQVHPVEGERAVPRNDAALPTGTVTFLFTDIEGSTRLVQTMGPGFPEVLERHHALMRRAIAEAGGVDMATEGDSFFAVFPDATAALEAAVGAQRSLAGEPWPSGIEIRVRMGLHTGEGKLGGDSYVGLDVHRAARIAAAGHGRQILLSAVTAELIRHRLPDGTVLDDLGQHWLKDLERPEHLYQLTVDGQTEFPALRSRRDQQVPVPVTDIVGRAEDLAAIRDLLLSDGTRLVTVTGPGGTGKTRLAGELFGEIAPGFPDGVYYLDLSAVSDPSLVLPAMGRVLGVVDAHDRDLTATIATIVGGARSLVIVDNMEQVIEAAPALAGVLEQTSKLKMLVTSREPLRVRGEFEYPLNPLPVPTEGTTPESLGQNPAVDLFVRRARAVAPGFSLDAHTGPVVAELVRKLDGLPLAIELAAPKLRVLSPEMLLDRMESHLDILQGGSRDLPERHHALRSTIAWSYELLEPEMQETFRRLGVFSGGWNLTAAADVAAPGGLDEVEFIDLMADLVAKSMVIFYMDSAGQPRYRLLETLRAYALEKLTEADDEEAARQAHLAWCLDFVRRSEERYTSEEFPRILDLLELERHNLRAALEFSSTDPAGLEKGMELAGLLWIFWDVRGYATEGTSWLRRLLADPRSEAPTRGRAVALDALGWLGRLTPEISSPEEAFEEADDIWRGMDDPRWLAWSLGMHGMITYNAFEPERAIEQFEEAARLARSIGDERWSEIWCNFGLSHAHWLLGDLETAERLLVRSLDFARKWNHLWAIAHGQFSLAILDFLRGIVDAARERVRESLTLRHEMRDARGIADCLGAMALVAGSGGDHRRAAVLLGAGEAQREAAGQVLVPWLEPFFDQVRQASLANLGSVEFEAAVAEGRALAREEAVALAISGQPVAS